MRLIVGAVILVLCGACSSPDPTPVNTATTPMTTADVAGDWLSESSSSRPGDLLLSLDEDGTFTATDDCDDYVGAWDLEGDAITLTESEGTHCGDPATHVHTALAGLWVVDGEELVPDSPANDSFARQETPTG